VERQVAENLNTPFCYSNRVERWGDIASPLLWPHAKYIILNITGATCAK
jgi:hypothetical protein